VTITEHATAEDVVRELFFTPAGRANPYPHYHRLRELAPVFRSETLQAWLLTRYDDCKSALRDPRLEKHFAETLDARAPGWRERPGLLWSSRTLLNLDAPEHTRLRRLVVREFTPKTVEQLRPKVEAMVDELLDAMTDIGELMEELAFKLPISVIGMLLGVPPEDRPQFRELTQRLTAVFELSANRAMLDEADAAVLECIAYFDGLIERRRAEPEDDLLSRLIVIDAKTDADAGEPDHLTNDELNNLAALLFLAGFETTTNLIGNGMISLLTQPEQMQALRTNPERCANVAEELLRHDGTVQLASRYATTDIAFRDATIPAGDGVFILLGAANRDPERYPDPDRIDFTREKVQPLSFGGGVHLCLGAPLARLETEIVFRKLSERYAAIELHGELPPHRDRLTLRAPSTVPLKFRRVESGGTPLGARPAGDDTQWRTEYRAHLDAQTTAMTAAERDARVALLQRVPFFAPCSGEELASLATTAYPISFDPGEHLCVEGSEAPDLYVIAAGTADVAIAGEHVSTVGADDVVGERGVILDATRAATVVATSHIIAFAISRERLRGVLDGSPRVVNAMRQHVLRRYS
jgi:cytochrome P450